MEMDVTGTSTIYSTLNTCKGVTTAPALTSTTKISMHMKCAQDAVVDLNSQWIAEVIQVRQIPMDPHVQI